MDDFLLVGSAAIDITAYTENIAYLDLPEDVLQRFICISFASKTELKNLLVFAGGSAANSAVMMGCLGARVSLLSAVGEDIFGDMFIDDLSNTAVHTRHIVRKARNTGMAIVLVSENGEKSILINRGANALLSPDDLTEKQVENTRRMFITSLMGAESRELLEKLVWLGRKHKRQIVLAPSVSMLHKMKKEIKKHASSIDMFIVNYEEGRFFTEKENAREMLDELPGRVRVVMHDRCGAYASEGDFAVQIGAPRVKIRNTTGAGDAYAAAFATEYYRTGHLGQALQLAAAAVTLKLQEEGPRCVCTPMAVRKTLREQSKYLQVQPL